MAVTTAELEPNNSPHKVISAKHLSKALEALPLNPTSWEMSFKLVPQGLSQNLRYHRENNILPFSEIKYSFDPERRIFVASDFLYQKPHPNANWEFDDYVAEALRKGSKTDMVSYSEDSDLEGAFKELSQTFLRKHLKEGYHFSHGNLGLLRRDRPVTRGTPTDIGIGLRGMFEEVVSVTLYDSGVNPQAQSELMKEWFSRISEFNKF